MVCFPFDSSLGTFPFVCSGPFCLRARILFRAYRKIPIISPGLIFVQKTFLLGLFRGSLFLEGLVIGKNFAFQNGFGLLTKTEKTKITA